MAEYKVRWITENLAAGYAPLSYADLEAIKEQSIDTIVNLCAEFCDFQEIERNTGFEVYYLPIADECSPDIEEMEKAFAWLDEAVMRGKKVLVHCRFGIGRTSTFVTAYLLRRGLSLKDVSKKLKGTLPTPPSYSQRRFLKKYAEKLSAVKTR